PSLLQRCVDGIRLATRIVQSKKFTKILKCDWEARERILNASVHANVNLVPKHPNDTKSIEQFCRDTVITIWHYHGGCHVGKVVNSEYKVIRVRRMRIVDGSVFDESPGTNPQATVMMMGRYEIKFALRIVVFCMCVPRLNRCFMGVCLAGTLG
ncbi:unnamed protein product, partial [Linum tenue]